MDFLTSDSFVTIVSVVGSAVGLFLAVGRRIDRVEESLGARIDRVEGRLGRRIDRVEDRFKELGEQIGELKTAVSVLDAKLDERSVPQRLAVQELPADYAVGDEPESG